MIACDRPRCTRKAPDGDLYCSTRCFDADNDPNPIQPIAANKVGGFGDELYRTMLPEPVILARGDAR